MTQPDIDRQPMLLRSLYGGATTHYYDENVAARDRIHPSQSAFVVTIRRYVRAHVKRPSRWQIGVIIEDDASNEDYWVGGATYRNGVYNAYLSGPRGTSRRIEITGLATDVEAIDMLRWAIAQLYP